jgi:hypothetical protein
VNAPGNDLLIVIISLGVMVPWIGWTVRRGLQSRRLPIGRGYVERDERPAPYWVLLTIYLLVALVLGFNGVKLLVGLVG